MATSAPQHDPSSAILASAGRVISMQFDLDYAVGDGSTLPRTDDLRAALVARIAELLSRDPERLMRILYRVDVEERKVQAIFRDIPPADMAAALADLILERQFAKAETRARYASTTDEDDIPPHSPA